jgi:hypothetical protein
MYEPFVEGMGGGDDGNQSRPEPPAAQPNPVVALPKFGDFDGVGAVASAHDLEAVARATEEESIMSMLDALKVKCEKKWGSAGPTSDDSKIADMKSAMNTGVFDMREHIGQKFYKDHPTGSEAHEKYKALKGREAKRLFRAEWAKKTFSTVVESKSHLRSFQHINTTTGTYRPLGAIVMKEGGWSDPAAVRGAKLLAAKCCIMGGQWVQRNPLTERLEFFHLKTEVSDKMLEAWSLCEHESKKLGSPGDEAGTDDVKGGNAGGGGTGASPEKGQGTGGEGGGDGSKKRKKTGEQGLPQPKPKAEKSVFTEASRLKSNWLATTAAAGNLIHRIKSNTEWEWARNDGNLGRLDASLKSLDASKSDFMQSS